MTSRIKRLTKLEQRNSDTEKCYRLVFQGDEQLDLLGDEDQNIFYISFEAPENPGADANEIAA